MSRRRSRQEPLHASGPCTCCRSGIAALPWATRATKGQVARPSHNAPAHFTRCPHSTLEQTTRESVHVTLARLRAKAERGRRSITRVALVAA